MSQAPLHPGLEMDATTASSSEAVELSDLVAHAAWPSTFVAEVVATDEAARPGRVLCRFERDQDVHDAWLPITRGVVARPFDRVLCLRAEGTPEPIVTAVIDGLHSSAPRAAASSPRLRLQADEALCIEAADGTPLVEVRAGEGRAVITVLEQSTEVALAGPLKLSAASVILEAREGDLRLDANGDAIVRGETIQLN